MNELPVGTYRMGSLADGDTSTPHIDVVLRRDAESITLEVPWNPTTNWYERWFRDGGAGERIAAPASLHFSDAEGTVLLVGCRAAGYKTNFTNGAGTVRVQYAVLNADDLRYERVNSLRWEVSGLRQWMGVSSIDENRDFAERRTNLVLKPRPSFGLEGRADVTFVPSTWWRQVSRDVHEAHDNLFVETTRAEASRWADHSTVPRMLRDLLVLSLWSKETYSIRAASRDDDAAYSAVTHEYLGRNWCPVVEADDDSGAGERTPSKRHEPALIEFQDLQLDGLERWFDLCERYSRVVDPIVTQRLLLERDPVAALTHAGPAVEALGYFLLLEDGIAERTAASAPLKARLPRIAEELANVMPFDVDEWAQSFPGTYNAVKHANRSQPSSAELLNVWGRSVLAVRAWVALRLGVDRDQLRERLTYDKQQFMFVSRPGA